MDGWMDRVRSIDNIYVPYCPSPRSTATHLMFGISPPKSLALSHSAHSTSSYASVSSCASEGGLKIRPSRSWSTQPSHRHTSTKGQPTFFKQGRCGIWNSIRTATNQRNQHTHPHKPNNQPSSTLAPSHRGPTLRWSTCAVRRAADRGSSQCTTIRPSSVGESRTMAGVHRNWVEEWKNW